MPKVSPKSLNAARVSSLATCLDEHTLSHPPVAPLTLPLSSRRRQLTLGAFPVYLMPILLHYRGICIRTEKDEIVTYKPSHIHSLLLSLRTNLSDRIGKQRLGETLHCLPHTSKYSFWSSFYQSSRTIHLRMFRRMNILSRASPRHSNPGGERFLPLECRISRAAQ